MAGPIETLGTLNGNFKYVYGDNVVKVKPEDIILTEDIPFEQKARLGRQYLVPVALVYPQSFSMTSSSNVLNLNTSVAGTWKEANVDAYQSILRDQMSYVAASRAASSKAAFKNETQIMVEFVRSSHMIKLEVLMMYGQSGLGVVSTVATDTLTMTTANWGPGIWTGTEGMRTEIRTAAGAFKKIATIVSVDLDNRTITLSAGEGAGVVGTDVLYFENNFGNEFAGIHKILTNSGTIFGIDASAYNLWKATNYSAGAATLTFEKVIRAAAQARPKGARGKIKLYVNPKTFADLENTIEAGGVRHADQSYSPNIIERGTQNLKFYGAGGIIEIQVHDIIWEGYAYGLIQDGSWMRIGSTDTTFEIPGQPGNYFIHLPQQAAYELRSWADYAPFCQRIGGNFIISNIVNTP